MTYRIYPLALLSLLILSSTDPLVAIEIPGARAVVDLMKGQFDLNRDDRVELSEWQSGTSESFALIDSDGDQKITAEEIDELASPIRREVGDFAGDLAASLVKKILLNFDTDADNYVSMEEYDEATESVFTKLDTDKNSELSEAEGLRFPTALLLN